MTRIKNFALKIKGGGREGGTFKILQLCHPPKKNLECAPRRMIFYRQSNFDLDLSYCYCIQIVMRSF